MVSDKVKSLTQTLMAAAALVTALTSLVKVLDKSVEQTSYETLAEAIHEMQADQAELRAELLTLRADQDTDGVCDATDYLTAGAGGAGAGGAGTGGDETTWTTEALMTPVVISVPKPTKRLPLRATPPPAWTTIKVRAEKL